MEDLQSKVAIITGGASGIGLAMGEAFAEAGMKIVLADIEAQALDRAVSSLRDRGADVLGVPTDVSKPEEIEALATQALRKYAAVHLVCNNAGVSVRADSGWACSLDDWNWILGVNLMSVVYGHRTFLPIFMEQGTEAHIVNTASFAGLVPAIGTAYSVTKAGVIALSEATYLELQQRAPKVGISVLCPAYVNTNINESQRNRPAGLTASTPPAKTPEAEVFAEWFQSQLTHGLSPRAVADQTVTAVRERRFYILTHPDFMPVFEARAKRIIAAENPQITPSPGFEQLMQMLQARLAHTG